MSIIGTLEALRDIEGVYGSFISEGGRVRARDLPKFFDDRVLRESSPRLSRVWETFSTLSEAGKDPSYVVLNYAGHKLYLRPVGKCVLCIVASSDINMPALRMAVNLVQRRLEPLLEEVPMPPPPVHKSDKPTLPATPVPKRQMVFRGKKYEV